MSRKTLNIQLPRKLYDHFSDSGRLNPGYINDQLTKALDLSPVIEEALTWHLEDYYPLVNPLYYVLKVPADLHRLLQLGAYTEGMKLGTYCGVVLSILEGIV